MLVCRSCRRAGQKLVLSTTHRAKLVPLRSPGASSRQQQRAFCSDPQQQPIAGAAGEAQANATAAGVVHRSSHSSTLASTASGGSGAKAAKQGAALHAPRARPQHAHAAVGQLLQQQLAPLMQQQFEIISEAPVHQRYLTVYNRHVRFSPQQDSAAPGHHDAPRVLEFDVVGHPRANFSFAVTFPFHPYTDGRKGGEVTLIREYAQGPHALMYCLPTGALDPSRHADLAQCAARELSEEAWLAGGQWHCLLPPGHAGLPEVKWCANRFMPFLVVAPQRDTNPGSRDAEEAGMEVLRLPLDEFRRLMVSGEMLLPSITTAYMALDRLAELGLL